MNGCVSSVPLTRLVKIAQRVLNEVEGGAFYGVAGSRTTEAPPVLQSRARSEGVEKGSRLFRIHRAAHGSELASE